MTDSVWRANRGRPLRGEIRLPGDKSVSHRALLLSALAQGPSQVRSLNPGADVLSTAQCLRALGVGLRELEPGGFEIRGRGTRWRPATNRLDCGNSGTTARLLTGALAGQPFTSTLDGDSSLRRRPMDRVARPLRALGARVEGPDNGRSLPLIVTGPLRRGGRVRTEVPSAQVKSCLLLAALVANLELELEEPTATRNHTEILLEHMGGAIEHGPGWARIRRDATLGGLEGKVPADPSAAALTLAVGVVVPGSELHVPELLLNPTRTGWLSVLERMGVGVQIQLESSVWGERVGKLEMRSGPELLATEVGPEEIASLVDEVPALAAVAAFARGDTVFRGVEELRLKESDRLEAIAALLDAWSIETQLSAGTLRVRGGNPSPSRVVAPIDDHRMAMAGAVLAAGVAARNPESEPVPVDLRSAAISDPEFGPRLEALQGGS